MTDQELLLLLRSKPQAGLERVVGSYSNYVLKIAYTRLGSVCTHEDIEEAVSDIFLKFFNAGMKNGFEFGSVRGILSVIAVRHCINVFRQRCKRAEEISLDEIIEYVADETPQSSQENTPLAHAVDSLGEPDRTIFIRKYFFGQKTADIAKELHMKPNSVDKRISRGLVKLRKILKEGEQ